MNKKLDKSLLPQPQKPVGWKRGLLQISTQSKKSLNNQSNTAQNLPATTKYSSSNNNNKRSFNNYQTPGQQAQRQTPSSKTYQVNKQSRQSIQDSGNNRPMGMTDSQYSLEQKELLTFAANQSNEDENQQREAQGSQSRQNRFRQTSQNQSQLDSSSQEQSQKINRSSSKNKQHKTIIYTHNLSQPEQFISYSVITKESKSGMFSNQKLLLINSFKRQLMYFSKLPKTLPFVSFNEMDKKYFSVEKPKEAVEFDKVRRFMFVPAKGSLATVTVNYVNEQGERKEWKLGMGNISVMNEWIELVNEVFKKEHYSVVKSQVKYPPKPKKQPQNKPNNYQTKFTKTLKQQVLPQMKQSSIRTSKANQNQLNQSQLSSGIRSTKNAANLSGSMSRQQQKQYIVDKSKFINTKNYIIDLEDVSNENIFYEPEKIRVEQPQQQQQQYTDSQKMNQVNHEVQLEHNSRFSRQLEQKQKDINNQHKNRISTFVVKQQAQQKPIIINETQPIILSKKSSNQRLSQTTHKDLNIHIDSRVALQEMERDMIEEEFRSGEGKKYGVGSQMYELQNSGIIMPATVVNHAKKKIVAQNQEMFYNQEKQPRNRIYTEAVTYSSKKETPFNNANNAQNLPQPQTQKLHFTHNSDSLRSSSQSSTPLKTSHKPKPILQQPPSHSHINRTRSTNSSSITQQHHPSQIQDIITNNKLYDGYILNFSPHSLSNNWLRLWLETQPMNRVDIYSSFIRACNNIAKKIVDTPQHFVTSCSFQENSKTHITFFQQNITFKLAYKFPLPQGLGEFISVMDFIRSQDFLQQVFKHQTELRQQYHNYQYILNQLKDQFCSGKLSLPVYFPMCCLVEYKGVTVLCKASLEAANLVWEKVAKEEYRKFESEIQYVEEACHMRFGVGVQSRNYPFDLYSIYLPSFSKTIIYMDNLSQFLPLLPNPLQKNTSPSLQLNSTYIQQHIKKGMISSRKDIDEIEKHLVGSVVKRYGDKLFEEGAKIFEGDDLRELLFNKGGLGEEYLGMVYRRVEDCGKMNRGKRGHNSELILTEIVLNQYIKAAKLYSMKEYLKQLHSLISTASSHQYPHLSTTSHKPYNPQFTIHSSFPSTVLQMLHYLLYRNSKVWNVICVALDEKYGISEFRAVVNQRQVVDMLMGKVCIEYLVLGLLNKLGVECEVCSWNQNMRWATLPLNENNLTLTPTPKTTCYPLTLFTPYYGPLIKQLQQLSQTTSFSSQLAQKSIYPSILQILNLSQESDNNHSTIIKSAAYQLLQLGFKKERLLIDLAISHFVPAFVQSDDTLNKNTSKRQQAIELYFRLLDQQMVRSSRDVSLHSFQICFNGIKWLIKQKDYQLVQVLIQEQLQAIDIWQTQNLLETKCKFLDLAAMFYAKKLGNKNNLAIEYSLKSLKLIMQNKSTLQLSLCAQKCFQAANIHYESSLFQKALQLYQLSEEYVFQSQKSRSLSQTDLSIQFLNVFVKKAEIKLFMGRQNDAMYQCLEGLRKCEEFQEIVGSEESEMEDNREREQLEFIEMNLFKLVFRCYEVGKNFADMKKISQLGCSKFVEDKLIMVGINHNSITKNLNPLIFSKLLKMCWISLISNLSQHQTTQQFIHQQQFLSKTFTTPSRKSFCLSLSQSQKRHQINTRNYHYLEQLQQKLQALTKLYPKNRYDSETLALFVCQEVEDTKMRMGKNVARKEYQLIGKKRKGVSDRVQRLIGQRSDDIDDMRSVLYDRLAEVVRELAGCRDNRNESQSRNRIQKFNTESGTNYQTKSRYSSRQARQRSIQRRPPLPYTQKKTHTKFYHTNQITTSQFDPFSPSDQNQPELRMSYILGQSQQQQHDSPRIGAYNMYSLKDEMDRKYMLVEAMFGLCGRDFVLGCVRDAMEMERGKEGTSKNNVFYQ